VYVVAMRALGISLLAFLSSAACGQAVSKTTSFDVGSVKPSQRFVGPDYNNQLAFSEVGLRAKKKRDLETTGRGGLSSATTSGDRPKLA
jgi:hypothetical protein